MKTKYVILFLRISIAIAFISAVADRLGFWPKEVSVWGNWEAFTSYTQILNPWMPSVLIPGIAIIVSVLEIALAILLLIGYKTKMVALISGGLILLFALSMLFTTGIKPALDYSVLTAAAACFGLYSLTNHSLKE